MKLLYFAWLRERIGLGEEDVVPPRNVATVGDLIDWLRTRGPGYANALGNTSVVRVAVNQTYVKSDHHLQPDDEVALFPPVTGG